MLLRIQGGHTWLPIRDAQSFISADSRILNIKAMRLDYIAQRCTMRPLGLRGQQKDLESQIVDFAAGLFKYGSNERIHKLELVSALSSFGCYYYVRDQWASTRQVEMEQKSLFATKNGYLCLAHSSAEIGDSIAVLLGADTT
jgi:hypothetical protein